MSGTRKTRRDPRLAAAGVSAYNRPKRTPRHPTKSHVVVAKVGNVVKTIRFGQQGAVTSGKSRRGESQRAKSRRKSFRARHRRNIARGPVSAAWWANEYKW